MQVRSYLGKEIIVKIDRPIGYAHTKKGLTFTYPINYGYIPNVIGGDGEELDVYVLGTQEKLKKCRAKVIGIVHRHNDVEDKLVATVDKEIYYQNDIAEMVEFQENRYETHIESLNEKSCGAVVFVRENDGIKYLLIRDRNYSCGVPKGHVEKGENEIQTALREIEEETGIKATLLDGFREEIEYTMPNGKSKRVVYFLGEYSGQTPSHVEGFETNEYMLLDFDKAIDALTYDNVKQVLKKANEFINK